MFLLNKCSFQASLQMAEHVWSAFCNFTQESELFLLELMPFTFYFLCVHSQITKNSKSFSVLIVCCKEICQNKCYRKSNIGNIHEVMWSSLGVKWWVCRYEMERGTNKMETSWYAVNGLIAKGVKVDPEQQMEINFSLAKAQNLSYSCITRLYWWDIIYLFFLWKWKFWGHMLKLLQ